MVTARGIAKWYTRGQPVSMLSEPYAAIGSGIWPVVIFLCVALIFHIALRYTRYGKFTYAIGANVQAARVSGINVGAHLMKVYAIAGWPVSRDRSPRLAPSQARPAGGCTNSTQLRRR
jgi:inositol transport system permease protein